MPSDFVYWKFDTVYGNFWRLLTNYLDDLFGFLQWRKLKSKFETRLTGDIFWWNAVGVVGEFRIIEEESCQLWWFKSGNWEIELRKQSTGKALLYGGGAKIEMK